MPDAYDRIESAPELGPQLRALPLLAPRESALPGLLAEVAARRRRRALGWLVPVAAAALLVLAVLPAVRTPPPSAPAPGPERVAAAQEAPDPGLANLMRANAVLEQRLATTRAAHITQDGEAAQASSQMEDMIMLVDAALGAGPAPAERQRLWQRRLELLQALNQVQRQGSFAPAQGDGRVYLASF